MSTSTVSRTVPFLSFLGSLAMVALLGIADNYTGWEYSFSIFYLLPIFVCVHYTGKWPGLFMALLCGFTVYAVDRLSVHPTPYSHAIVAYWNGLALLGFFVIFTLLVASLDESLEREKGINRNLESLLTLAPYDERGWNLPFRGTGAVGAGAAPQKQPAAPEDSKDEEIKQEGPKQSG